VAQPTNHTPRSLTHDAATAAWEEAYAYKAEIDARDAERAAPHRVPVITMAVLLVFSVAMLVAQCVFLPETL
jgi:hypothetical protein